MVQDLFMVQGKKTAGVKGHRTVLMENDFQMDLPNFVIYCGV
jgi:hypothetical protein